MPSPKFQLTVTGSPSASAATALNVTKPNWAIVNPELELTLIAGASAQSMVSAHCLVIGRVRDADLGLARTPLWYCNTMRSTIDKAGRVVIPAAFRERLGLRPGTTLEISADETGVRIDRIAPGPKLVRIGKRLVARPTVSAEARPPIDVAALVDDERNRWP